MDLFDIKGWRAIVTGGTRGLGHGVAEGLMEAGARVVIFGTSAKVEQVAADFRDRGFDCNVLAYDVYLNHEVAEKYNVTFTDFDDLLAKSDFVAILVPLLDSTFEMFNAESLAKCKDGVIIDALEGREPQHRRV